VHAESVPVDVERLVTAKRRDRECDDAGQPLRELFGVEGHDYLSAV
jgi:hypothetical protein